MSFEPKEGGEPYGHYGGVYETFCERRTSTNSLMPEVAGPAIASKLPFDILAQIFEEFLAHETPENPVEILLLICKWWHQAALDHPSLWSTFVINSCDFGFWLNCIPRRLHLCPSDRLLDIRIVNRIQTDREGDRQRHQNILSFLTGKDGEVARRWRRFSVCDSGRTLNDPYKDPNLTRYFMFPTPNLQYLSLIHLHSSSPIFPETPSLKVFYAHGLKVPAFPNLSSAIDVSIFNCQGLKPSLPENPHLVSLKIGNAPVYFISKNRSYLSGSYPRLKSFKLWGGLSDDEILRFSAPALKRLCVVTSGGNLKRILSCKGLPFEQIRELELYLDRSGQSPQHHDVLCQLLCATKNISVLRMRDAYTLCMVTEILNTDCQSLYNDHTLVLKVAGHGDVELRPGVARGPVIDALIERVPDAKRYLKPPGNV